MKLRPLLIGSSLLVVSALGVGVAEADWNEAPAPSPGDESEYLAVVTMPDGDALLAGQRRGPTAQNTSTTAVQSFIEHRDADGDIDWSEPVGQLGSCAFDDDFARRHRADATTAYFVVDTCDDATLVSADGSGVVATIALSPAAEVATLAASPTGGVHVLATERAMTGGVGTNWSVYVLDRDLNVERTHPVPVELVSRAATSADAGTLVSSLVAENGDAWLIGATPNGPDVEDDSLTAIRFSPGEPDMRVDHPNELCPDAVSSGSALQGVQNLDGQLWITGCSSSPTEGGSVQPVIVALDDGDGSLLGRIPLPPAMASFERFAGQAPPIQFSTDGRLATTGDFSGRVIWQIDGDLSSTTWGRIALSDSGVSPDSAYLPSFDRLGDDYVAVGYESILRTDGSGSGDERAIIVRRSLPSMWAVTPARLLDTRQVPASDAGSFASRVGAGSTTTVTVAGRADVIEGAAAAIMTVTAVDPQRAGFITTFPCNVDRPVTASLNFAASTTVGNTVTTALDADGDVCVYTSAPTDLVIDVVGYYRSTPNFEAIAPARLLETRAGESSVDGIAETGATLAAGVAQTVPVVDRVGIDATARWVVVNVTAVNPAATGFLTLYSCDDPVPPTSSLNFRVGSTSGNQAVVPIGASGTLCVRASVPTDVVIDAGAWMREGEDFRFGSGVRYLDSRPDGTTFDGQYFAGGPVFAGSTIEISTNIRGWEPDGRGATQVIGLNVTAVNPDRDGFITVWPCGQIAETFPRPLTSSLNFSAGQTSGNTVLVPVPDFDGVVCVFSTATADIVIDVVTRR